jgi:hypothetical protein
MFLHSTTNDHQLLALELAIPNHGSHLATKMDMVLVQ